MFGSDWPVLTLAGNYRDWYDSTLDLTDPWSEGEKRNFYDDHSVRFKRL